MVTYPGSFAGHLVCLPDPEINYIALQDVLISVRQQDKILSQVFVNKIDQIGQSFELSFDYISLNTTVQLIFETCNNNDQFNRDNPVIVTQLILDDLFTIPHFLGTGVLTEETTNSEPGNVLWKTGQLVYTFNLPLISGCRLNEV
jgi:hypothetical protein